MWKLYNGNQNCTGYCLGNHGIQCVDRNTFNVSLNTCYWEVAYYVQNGFAYCGIGYVATGHVSTSSYHGIYCCDFNYN